MNVSTGYRMLKDAVIYSIHYAPEYPREDETDIDQECKTIGSYLDELRSRVRTSYSLQQLDIVRREVMAAFDAYRLGQDGRRQLEDALALIERSSAGKPPSTDFVSGLDGTTRQA